MLDGRIDTQGTIKDLRAQGVLDDIEHDSAIAVKEEEVVASEESVDAAEEEASPDGASKSVVDKKKARQLVKDEHRETGEVKVCHLYPFMSCSLHDLVLVCDLQDLPQSFVCASRRYHEFPADTHRDRIGYGHSCSS